MVTPADSLKILYNNYLRGLQGVSDWLRDDLPPASPGIAKWAQETGRRACRKYARQRGNVPFLTNDPTWDGMCSGYWGAINEGPTSGGSYQSPFTGGQCAAHYLIFANRNLTIAGPNNTRICDTDNNIIITTPAGQIGPIRGIVTRNQPAIPGTGMEDVEQGVLLHGNNQETILGNRFYGCNLPFYTITNVQRVDGGPDNCGNPSSQYRPPTFPPNLPALPNPTNPAPGFGNNWEVNLLPDGQINICIGGECSGGTPPDGGGGPDSGGGPGEEDGDPQETDPNDPNNPNEVSGCAEDGNVLTGVQIDIIQEPPNYQGLGNIYYRSCWVWMGPSSGLLDMVSDGKAIESGQFVIPDSPDCVCYKVRANPGFRVSVQAYSRPKEE